MKFKTSVISVCCSADKGRKWTTKCWYHISR